MFENPGEKIKTLAKVLFVIGIIVTLILAISGSTEKTYSRYSGYTTEFHFGSFILIMAVGCLTSYVSNLLLAGFGELISNTDPGNKTNTNTGNPSGETYYNSQNDNNWR